jgi:molybdopterin-guanine dinucleotide biosynthesis protein A
LKSAADSGSISSGIGLPENPFALLIEITVMFKICNDGAFAFGVVNLLLLPELSHLFRIVKIYVVDGQVRRFHEILFHLITEMHQSLLRFGMQRTAGFVLVGGRSSRMGKDKARLKVGSQLMVEVVARAVAETAGSVTLIGNPEAFADLPFECLPDTRSSSGPLAGLESALAAHRAELNLVTGCDMPDLQRADLECLLAATAQNESLCTVVRDASGRRHPLCAVYRLGALPFIRRALDDRRLRLQELVEELKAEEVPIDSVLNNLNTPEQWAAWQTAQPAKRI